MSLIKISSFRLDLIEALDSEVDFVYEDYMDEDFAKYIAKGLRAIYEA